MVHQNSLKTTALRLTGPFDYRHLVAATAVLTYATILLGVSTKATGSGLACNANWPLCDGGLLNLFPASMPSFFEWFHRVVAAVTGFFILGSAVGAWRDYGDDPVVKWAATLGLVLLPIQVTLGRQTVFQYTALILAAHYWVAMSIFGSFVVVTVRTWRDAFEPRHITYALMLSLVLIPAQTALGPQVVSSYTAPIQATHYGVMLLFFAALLVAAVAGWRYFTSRLVRTMVALALVLLPIQILFARQLAWSYAFWAQAAHSLVTVGLFVSVLLALVQFRRSALPTRSATHES